jgi:hypothetical protein
MTIPRELRQGDSASWIDAAFTDNLGRSIDSSQWTLTYFLRASNSLTLVGIAEGPGWKTTIGTTDSATLVAGVYYWQAVAAWGSEKITRGSGQISILPNLATGTDPFDGRSQVERDLASVQAAMRSIIAGGAVAEYTIMGRSMKKMQMADLIVLENKLKVELSRETRARKLANGEPDPNKILVRFTR